jgi:hypothetical protein
MQKRFVWGVKEKVLASEKPLRLRLCIRIFRVADGGIVKLMISGCISSVKLSFLSMEISRGGCKVIYIIFKT